jgi:hypothetical protein
LGALDEVRLLPGDDRTRRELLDHGQLVQAWAESPIAGLAVEVRGGGLVRLSYVDLPDESVESPLVDEPPIMPVMSS